MKAKDIEVGNPYKRVPGQGASTWPLYAEVMEYDNGYVGFKELGGSDRFTFRVHSAVFEVAYQPSDGPPTEGEAPGVAQAEEDTPGAAQAEEDTPGAAQAEEDAPGATQAEEDVPGESGTVEGDEDLLGK